MRLDAFALAAPHLRFKELVQRFLLPLHAKPQRLTGLQVAHHRQKLVALAAVNLIHTHLPERRLAPLGNPSFQVAQIDGPHRSLGQTETSSHLSRRCAFACLSDCILEAFAERRLTGQ
jgi:hypothetical protein